MLNSERNPVIAGLVALATVAIVVGLLGGVAAVMGAKAVGIGGGDASASGTPGSQETMYVPEPTETATAEPQTDDSQPQQPQQTQEPAEGISLTAAQTNVAPMQQIDLTGTYPGGDGAVLQVQRFEGGSWSNFPVTMTVSSQKFATYVMTGRSGENRFRVIDSDTQAASNEITVTVG